MGMMGCGADPSAGRGTLAWSYANQMSGNAVGFNALVACDEMAQTNGDRLGHGTNAFKGMLQFEFRVIWEGLEGHCFRNERCTCSATNILFQHLESQPRGRTSSNRFLQSSNDESIVLCTDRKWIITSQMQLGIEGGRDLHSVRPEVSGVSWSFVLRRLMCRWKMLLP